VQSTVIILFFTGFNYLNAHKIDTALLFMIIEGLLC